jgi:ubiquinone/menaquinone biosynthesis C-methylase UbiE
MSRDGRGDQPWWRHYFDHAYFDLHDPLFEASRSRAEVAAIREMLALPVDARVLDAPCGWGRHTALLAEASCDVVGCDLSFDLMQHATRDTGARYVAADIRDLPFRDASFDAVLNVYTSLGLFLDDAEDITALREARRVLTGDGVFLLESMHRDDVISQYAERDAWDLPDGTEVRVQRKFDAVTGISHERMRWRRGSEKGEKRHALKLRTATEINQLLRAAGFTSIEYFGDWSGSPLRHDSEHFIAVASILPRA